MKIYVESFDKTYDTTELVKFGVYKYNDKPIYLTQDAYVDNDGTNGDVVYKAHAIDEQGNAYNVRWDVYDTDDENEYYIDKDGEPRGTTEDESNACDWDVYSVTKY